MDVFLCFTLITIYNNKRKLKVTLTWGAEGDDKNIDKKLKKFEEHCEPRNSYEKWRNHWSIYVAV